MTPPLVSTRRVPSGFLQVISEALMSLTAEEADGTFAKVYMPIVVEGHKRSARGKATEPHAPT